MRIDRGGRPSWRRRPFIWDDGLRSASGRLSRVCWLGLGWWGCDGSGRILRNLLTGILLRRGSRRLTIGRLCSRGCVMACIITLINSRLSYISHECLHWYCGGLNSLLILLYSPYLIKFVSVVVIWHYHIVLVISKVYGMIEIKAWFVLVEMHLSSDTVQNV